VQDRAGVGYQPQHHHCDREKGQRDVDVRRDGGEEEWGRMGERREGEEGGGGRVPGTIRCALHLPRSESNPYPHNS